MNLKFSFSKTDSEAFSVVKAVDDEFTDSFRLLILIDWQDVTDTWYLSCHLVQGSGKSGKRKRKEVTIERKEGRQEGRMNEWKILEGRKKEIEKSRNKEKWREMKREEKTRN